MFIRQYIKGCDLVGNSLGEMHGCTAYCPGVTGMIILPIPPVECRM